MKVFRILALFLFSVLLLLGALVSPWGTQLLLSAGNTALDELDIQYESGGLYADLNIEKLVWQSQGQDIEINGLLIDIDWSCTLTVKACFNRLYAASLNAKVVPSTTPSAPTDSLKVTLPVPVSITSMGFGEAYVESVGNAQVELGEMEGGLWFFRTLRLDHLTLNKAKVILASVEAKSSPEKQWDFSDIANWRYTPPADPGLRLPIKIVADKISLSDLSVWQNEQETFQIDRLDAAISSGYSKIQQLDLSLTNAQLSVQLNAQVDSNLKHQLNADIRLSQAQNVPLNVNLKSSGMLNSLAIEIESNGLANSQLSLELDLLDKALPIAAKLAWQDVWFESAEGRIESESGLVSLDGNLQSYHLQARADLSGVNIPTSKLSLNANGNNQFLDLVSSQIETLNGKFETSGKLVVTDSLNWQGTSGVTGIEPHRFWPEYQASLNGQLTHQLLLAGSVVEVEISDFDLLGVWHDYLLEASGGVKYHSVDGLTVPKVVARLGDNNLTLSGEMNKAQEVTAKLLFDAKDFSQFSPELAGSSEGDIDVSGTLEQPSITLSAAIENAVAPGIQITSGKITGSGIWDEQKTVYLDLRMQKLLINQNEIERANLTLLGDAQEHRLVATVESTLLNLESTITGSLVGQSWAGRWENGRVESAVGNYRLNESQVPLRADWLQGRYEIGAHCWRDNGSSLCVKKADYATSSANFDVSGDKIRIVKLLSSFVPRFANVQSLATLDFSITGAWQGVGLPEASFNATVSPASWQIDDRAVLQIGELAIQSRIEKQNIFAHTRLQGEQIGDLDVVFNLAGTDKNRQVDGKLALTQFQLEPWKAFVPELSELAGELSANVTMKGELTALLLEGEAKISDTMLSSTYLPSRINQVNQHIHFNGQSLNFAGPFNFGKGRGNIDGELSWRSGLAGKMLISGRDMEIDYQNMLRARLSPDLSIEFNPQKITLTGDVGVPYARVKVRELPPEALSPSDDTVILNQAEGQNAEQTEVEVMVNVLIDKDKVNEVKLDAFGLTSDLQGSLSLRKEAAVIIGNGELQLINGRYRAYGQDLKIRQGEILFSGPIDSPTLNIEAIRDPVKTADDVIAGLRVEGIADQARVEIFSEPGMEQSEALSYLLRGQSIKSPSETSSDAALADALISFGLSKSENKITKVGQKLGVEDLAIATSGQGEETKLSVSGYVAPGVQLRYGVGVFDSASEVALRYQIMPQLYLEAVSGLNNALDLYYQMFIGTDESEKEQAVPE